jgi:hypothetical protein
MGHDGHIPRQPLQFYQPFFLATIGPRLAVIEGQSIGRKRIERFQPPIVAEKVRLRMVQANAVPNISATTVQ